MEILYFLFFGIVIIKKIKYNKIISANEKGEYMEIKNKLKKVLLMTLLMVVCFYNTVLADVGSFESYDSGSSWSSSDFDYDYDDYDYDSSGSSFNPIFFVGGGSIGDFFGFLIMMAIFIGVSILIRKYGRKNTHIPRNNYVQQNIFTEDENQIEAKIKANDPMFNKEEFLSWAKSLFVKLQEAWSDRDWSTIRTFESNELFEQHHKQLQGYIDNNQINVMERICVKSARLENFSQVGDKDIIKVVLSSKMVDYIIDATTKELLKGDKQREIHSTYRLTFIRKTGVKTKAGTSQVNTTNCPNCGAPTQITSSGKCEYCGSVITTGEHSWVLSDLSKIG